MGDVMFPEWQKFISKPSDGFLEHNIKNILKIAPYILEYGAGTTLAGDLRAAKILHQIKLGDKIGSGAFGYVFEIDGSNKVIKISGDARTNDEERYCNMMDQMFAGTASLEDMHFFDYGSLGDSGLNYLIMPMVVPLTKSPIYNKTKVLFYVAGGIAWVTITLSARNAKPSYQDYEDRVLDKAFSLALTPPTSVKEEEFELYGKIIHSMIRAGYRAYTVFGGTDLHIGNIGYLPQKPDILFYFDM